MWPTQIADPFLRQHEPCWRRGLSSCQLRSQHLYEARDYWLHVVHVRLQSVRCWLWLPEEPCPAEWGSYAHNRFSHWRDRPSDPVFRYAQEEWFAFWCLLDSGDAYAVTYGISARKRERLMAVASSRCFFAETAEMRDGTILPRSDV